jgi:hypothetical protein
MRPLLLCCKNTTVSNDIESQLHSQLRKRPARGHNDPGGSLPAPTARPGRPRAPAFAIGEGFEMTRKIMAFAALITVFALTGCKFESMSAFDNNCSGNGGMTNQALCDEHFLK